MILGKKTETITVTSIEAALRRKGWSLNRLARESGVSGSTLWRYVKDGYVPRLDTAMRIAETLEMKLEDLWLLK